MIMDSQMQRYDMDTFFILPKSSGLKISKFDFQGLGTSDLFYGFRHIKISHKNPFFLSELIKWSIYEPFYSNTVGFENQGYS